MKAELKKLINVKRGDFTLRSGIKSNLYFDCKSPFLTSYGQWVLGNVLYKMMPLNCSFGGPAVGSLAMTFALLGRDIDAGFYTKDGKVWGNVRQNVVILEDVITTGNSVDECIRLLVGHNIVKVICIVKRGDYNCPYPLEPIFRLEDFNEIVT